MARRPQRDLRALQETAFSLLARGATAAEAAQRLAVSARTLRRWRQQKQEANSKPVAIDKLRRQTEALKEMLRAEGPAVARVLLDLAKGGDVRAAALVVKLLGNTLTEEESDDADTEADLSELERELRALPSAIASEIVGLLAQADSHAAHRPRGQGAPLRGGARRTSRLPWQEEDYPPDEGTDPF